ncbi:MAG TPA: globin [Bryobacteraceae bacterium]|nr:globin [Bryobacteraceae bacterium]
MKEAVQYHYPVDDQEIFGIIGTEGFERLVAAFYRQIPDDPILGPMYPKEDLAGAERRLRDFLIFRFGGPQHYLENRGHPRLRMRHAPFPVDAAARNRWMEIMTAALLETGLPNEVNGMLWEFFNSVATAMMNREG